MFRRRKIENTKKSPKIGWLLGGNPQAIEDQEKEGQQQLTLKKKVQQLPSKVQFEYSEENSTKRYKTLGFKVISESKGDSLFLDVKLLKGWELKVTDHSMWSDLIDDKGRKRAEIFYKAAFYDRSAFIRFNNRISYRVARIGYHNNDYSQDENHNYNAAKTPFCGIVKDFDNKTLFKTEESMIEIEYKGGKRGTGYTEKYKYLVAEVEKRFEKECLEFLKKNYPNWEDELAYWD